MRVDVAADPDVAYNYYYNDRWQMLEERAGSSLNPAQQLVWHPYYIDALAVRYWDGNVDGDYEDTNEGAQYYLQDANFNVTAVVDAGGTVLERYRFTPYGEVTFLEPDFDEASPQSSTIGNTHLYTGRERDPETGLQLNRMRYYAPHLGRWLTRDPIGYSGEGYSLYNYVGNRPVLIIDPQGLQPLYEDFGGPDPPPPCVFAVIERVSATFGPGDSDKYKHCVVSCYIKRECGVVLSIIAGIGKEIIDVFGPGNAELGDLGADMAGWLCGDNTSCEQQCRKKYP